jgi:SAM-dependent methyltransferase
LSCPQESGHRNEKYDATELLWSAGPNQFVESFCKPLPPGRAIDLAAGEGRNAVWLAELGWDATAVDFSDIAIAKAEEMAQRRGVEITAVVADLNDYTPAPDGYDLVIVAYFHVPEVERSTILRRAAQAVAPGGKFLLVAHDLSNIGHGHGGPQDPDVLTTPEGVVADLGPALVIDRAEVIDRLVETESGTITAKDTYVEAHREQENP